uniref:Uncharacterized protein n=1 Tax=Pseudomonas phage Lepni01 TaxID=3138536 RepID=A0AAU6W450_9VIRU
MSLHSNFQPSRTGLTCAKIHAAKTLRDRRNPNNPEVFEQGYEMLDALIQRERLNYSDQGDFTRCYRGGF